VALNIKNREVEELAAEIASQMGETKTETIRRALEERRSRLELQAVRRRRGERFLKFLEEEIWPTLPPEVLGRRLSKEEEDQILGYGPEGV
jgi:antitoxin VapB